MFVEVDLTVPSPAPELLEPADFGSFKLVAKGGGAPEQIVSALAPIGTVDPDGTHAWLQIDSLRQLAGTLSQDDAWNEKFDGMIAYAGSKGWLSPDGDAIRAHVEAA